MSITRYVVLFLVLAICCQLSESKSTRPKSRNWRDKLSKEEKKNLGRRKDTKNWQKKDKSDWNPKCKKIAKDIEVNNAAFTDRMGAIGLYRVYRCKRGFVMNIPEKIKFICKLYHGSKLLEWRARKFPDLLEWRARKFPDLELKNVKCKKLAECAQPPPPAENMTMIVDERYKLLVKNRIKQLPREGYFTGDAVKYECNSGYHQSSSTSENNETFYDDYLYGFQESTNISSELTCDDEGRWNGHQDIDLGTCTVTECTATPFSNISNGNVINYRDTYGFLEEMELTCDPGFRPIDGIDAVTCLKPNSFHIDLQGRFGCEPIVCSEPANPINGFVRLLGRGVGENATFYCNDGYTLMGNPHWTCQESGHWDQSCVICVSPDMFCTPPCVPPGAYLKTATSSFTVGSTVELSCKGKVFGGSEKRTCLSNQMWSGSQLDCTGQYKIQDFGVGIRLMEAMHKFNVQKNLSMEWFNMTDGQNYTDDTDEASAKSIHVGASDGVDLYILIDVSKSTAGEKFDSMNNFTKALLPELGIGQDNDGTRLALYYFASTMTEVVNHHKDDGLEKFKDYKAAQEEIDKVDRKKIVETTGSGTALNKALKDILEYEKTRQLSFMRGDITRDPQVVLIVLSDGEYTTSGDPEETAAELKSDYDVEIYSIAVGSKTTGWDSMKKIASDIENEQHFFKIDTEDTKLNEVIKSMIDPSSLQLSCGFTKPSKTKLAENSTKYEKDAVQFAWPWMAQLTTKNVHMCGGSLIDRRWILTAAHCFNGSELAQVYLRRLDKSSEEGALKYHVSDDNVYKHPSYNNSAKSWAYDVALVRLEEEVTFNTEVNNVCLWSEDMGVNHESLYHNKIGIVTGWGKRASNALATVKILKQMQMEILDNCTINLDKNEKKKVKEDVMFCAGGKDGDRVIDTCSGDSGGPFVVQHPLKENFFIQTGIVSFGFGCKQEGKHGFYTKLTSEIIDWIHDKKFEVDNSRRR